MLTACACVRVLVCGLLQWRQCSIWRNEGMQPCSRIWVSAAMFRFMGSAETLE